MKLDKVLCLALHKTQLLSTLTNIGHIAVSDTQSMHSIQTQNKRFCTVDITTKICASWFVRLNFTGLRKHFSLLTMLKGKRKTVTVIMAIGGKREVCKFY